MIVWWNLIVLSSCWEAAATAKLLQGELGHFALREWDSKASRPAREIEMINDK